MFTPRFVALLDLLILARTVQFLTKSSATICRYTVYGRLGKGSKGGLKQTVQAVNLLEENNFQKDH